MHAQLRSLPDAKVHPPVTLHKVYEVRGYIGNGAIILSDDMKTIMLIRCDRFLVLGGGGIPPSSI